MNELLSRIAIVNRRIHPLDLAEFMLNNPTLKEESGEGNTKVINGVRYIQDPLCPRAEGEHFIF